MMDVRQESLYEALGGSDMNRQYPGFCNIVDSLFADGFVITTSPNALHSLDVLHQKLRSFPYVQFMGNEPNGHDLVRYSFDRDGYLKSVFCQDFLSERKKEKQKEIRTHQTAIQNLNEEIKQLEQWAI